MKFEITGRIVFIGELTGNEKYRKQQAVLQCESYENGTLYETNAVVSVCGGALNALSNMRIGEMVTATFSPSSNQWQGKWYPELKCFFIRKAT